MQALLDVAEAAAKVMAVPGEVWHGKELNDALAKLQEQK
jgi:hypothetical protein